MQRDEAWRSVWSDREPDRADWNGFEDCFDTAEAYLRWVSHVADFITHELSLTSHDTVADLGCGSGRIADLLAPRVAAVHCFDYSAPALSIARERTARHGTVSVASLDLNEPPANLLAGVPKAYSVAAMYYLKSVEHVLELASRLVDAGTDLLLVDLPDADRADQRGRGYDQTLYSHLAFRTDDFTERFPMARVLRDQFPEYINDPVRFSVLIPGERD